MENRSASWLRPVLALALASRAPSALAGGAPEEPGKTIDVQVIQPDPACMCQETFSCAQAPELDFLEPEGGPHAGASEAEVKLARALATPWPVLAAFVTPYRGKPQSVAVDSWNILAGFPEKDGECVVTATVLVSEGVEPGQDPKVERQTAPLSSGTCTALRALWRAALVRVRPLDRRPYELGAGGKRCGVFPLHSDYRVFTDRELIVGRRSGVVPFHLPGSRMDALVRLAEDLFAFARAPSDGRAALDALLGKRAEDLARRFRSASLPPPKD